MLWATSPLVCCRFFGRVVPDIARPAHRAFDAVVGHQALELLVYCDPWWSDAAGCRACPSSRSPCSLLCPRKSRGRRRGRLSEDGCRLEGAREDQNRDGRQKEDVQRNAGHQPQNRRTPKNSVQASSQHCANA